MTDSQKLLRRRRRRKARLRRFYALILAPARLPRISYSLADSLIKISEVSGIAFVITIMACMVKGNGFTSFLAFAAGVVFFASIILIWLQNYQNILREHGYMN